jgi:hypothetical protein
MENDRFRRWVESSHALARIEPFMVPIAQGLGRLDIDLIQGDQRFSNLSQEERSSIDESTRLTNHMTSSYLWVLGAYELVRAVVQRCRKNPHLLGSQLTSKATDVRDAFERLRIPLAKFEPSNRHQKTDSPIAYPALHKELGASWHIAADVFISRRELSNILLTLLEEMATTSDQPHQSH